MIFDTHCALRSCLPLLCAHIALLDTLARPVFVCLRQLYSFASVLLVYDYRNVRRGGSRSRQHVNNDVEAGTAAEVQARRLISGNWQSHGRACRAEHR